MSRGGKNIVVPVYSSPGTAETENVWGGDSFFNFAIAAPAELPNTGITLYWQLNPVNISSDIYFTIFRYDNQGDPDTEATIASDLLNVWTYNDSSVVLRSKFFQYAYRIKATWGTNTHLSPLIFVLSPINVRKRLLARAILRRFELNARTLPSFEGFLLKRKLFGTTCSQCVNPFTREVTNSDCQTCKGTGIVNGYWNTGIKRTITLSSKISDIPNFDLQLALGTINSSPIRALIPGLPPILPYDVWVSKETGKRFYINTVETAADLGGVPLIYNVELQEAEKTDVVYGITVQ